jgi:hypothetical protein
LRDAGRDGELSKTESGFKGRSVKGFYETMKPFGSGERHQLGIGFDHHLAVDK